MLKEKHVYLIGIGGIGVSAIAKMFLFQGAKVSGSDVSTSPVTDELLALGVPIHLGHARENVPRECDLVVYTNALSKDNPELLEAKKRGIRTLSYPEALGEISMGKFVIAVSGSAGKTTTTAMIGQIMIDAGLLPTVVVGSMAHFRERDGNVLKTNFIAGGGKYLVVEADEYKRAFLNLKPNILTINNIEPDHLDYYRDLSDLQSAFRELAKSVPKDGFIVCRPEGEEVRQVLTQTKAVVLDYSTIDVPEQDFSLPGKHNKDNAKVAATVASAIGIKKEIIYASLSGFVAPWRRFEYKGKTKGGALLYDDYAHNPQKVKALIAGAREMFPDKRIVIVFQPHLYSRTKQMLAELAESLVGADRVVVAPIYAAREKLDPTVTHQTLAAAVSSLDTTREVETVDSFDELPKALKLEGGGAIILTVGAGDIYTACISLLDK